LRLSLKKGHYFEVKKGTLKRGIFTTNFTSCIVTYVLAMVINQLMSGSKCDQWWWYRKCAS